MNEFFADLLRYTHQSNQQMIAVLEQYPELISEKAHKLLSHTLNAQHIWNHRIAGQTPAATVWQLQPIAELRQMDAANFEGSIALLSRLDEEIRYANTQGQSFGNTVRDILFHVINHATYHRAQIATELKQAGLEVPSTDFIVYKRQK